MFVLWDFDEVDPRVFVEQCLWVIYVFRVPQRRCREALRCDQTAFHDLDPAKVAAMNSIDASLLPIRNQRKADAFIKGCKLIVAEGWDEFKERPRDRGRAALMMELPFMGPQAALRR